MVNGVEKGVDPGDVQGRTSTGDTATLHAGTSRSCCGLGRSLA